MEKFETKQIEKLAQKKRIPAFRPGDTLKVTIKITEGEKSRLQAFEGVCVARKNNSVNSNFTVRKISHGEGVERVFPLFNPLVEKIEVIRKGDVKRAKLYYLRDRTGKNARIADRDRGEEADQYDLVEEIQPQEKEKNIEEKNDLESNNSLKEESEKLKETENTDIEEDKVEATKTTDSSQSESEIKTDEKQS
tara:strand:+ start:1335 stop:1913 length:579 start_codon:yes stop_codon:yes gene_type:complete